LGLRLKRAGKQQDALARFKEALADSQRKCDAAYEIAYSLQQSGDPVGALRHYRLAADAALQASQLSCKKQALYRAAGLSAKLRLYKLARRHLAELHRLDPHYKEASSLLRALP
jgi:tetratricopeptide (TPR) repeat protein